MYLKIEGNLIDVLGDKARGNIENEFGIKVSPEYQFLDGTVPVTLAIVLDQAKASKLLSDTRVIALDTVEEFNAEIDSNYIEKYALVDSVQLQLDLQLSGQTSITGYNPDKPLSDQENLKAIYDANMGGIKKKPKPPYLGQ